MITIKQEVVLNIDTDKDNFIVYDLGTLSMLMGGNSVGQNAHMWNITKTKRKGHMAWVIPMQSVRDRIQKVENDIKDWTTRVAIMKTIVKTGGK